ncbi:MAG: hypothetical protein M1812_003511 [Candelaria pacifica]|nr:MAG: hypothetical protein M1812_003511 [Candelaria pacifica]
MEGTAETLSQQPVSVNLEDLKAEKAPLSSLEEAFGPSSLGIIIVNNLPAQYVSLRQRLLSYASYLAALPTEELETLTSPSSKYLVGWSLGKETLKSGHYDTLKGSYYVNCAFYTNPILQSAPADGYPSFPEYTAPNIWPSKDLLPGFRSTFEELATLIIDVAALVAKACDIYSEKNIEGYKQGYLEHVVRTSMTTKARLLHYFPPTDDSSTSTDQHNDDDDDWCATHVDHGCLTGLTSAMFIDELSNPPTLPASSPSTPTSLSPLPELPSSPSPSAGLYIHSRTNSITKINIPHDSLAFQTGEALEVITEGKFKAVPHFVKGGKAGMEGARVARNTLAVFTQPNLWEMVDGKRDFAAFARGVVEKNH